MHEFAIKIIDRLSSDDFLRLPLDGQFSFLDLVRSRYESTSHPSAPSVAQAIQRVFQGGPVGVEAVAHTMNTAM